MLLSTYCSTAIALRLKDGVVFAVQKIVKSKLHENTSNQRIFTVDQHIGLVSYPVDHGDNMSLCQGCYSSGVLLLAMQPAASMIS